MATLDLIRVSMAVLVYQSWISISRGAWYAPVAASDLSPQVAVEGVLSRVAAVQTLLGSGCLLPVSSVVVFGPR
jgi:hypothetical protein